MHRSHTGRPLRQDTRSKENTSSPRLSFHKKKLVLDSQSLLPRACTAQARSSKTGRQARAQVPPPPGSGARAQAPAAPPRRRKRRRRSRHAARGASIGRGRRSARARAVAVPSRARQPLHTQRTRARPSRAPELALHCIRRGCGSRPVSPRARVRKYVRAPMPRCCSARAWHAKPPGRLLI
jgi:hypothetical protein